jgi:flagellin
MRADIASLNQGVRNANDAISMIQTADGALGVIDEKLIRMKELATQAATGTYNSDQRLIIDSEYQQMASEITRIANATDFNGIYLLNGNLSASDTNKAVQLERVAMTAADCSPPAPEGPLRHGQRLREDYYYIAIGNATASALGVGNASDTTRPTDARREGPAASASPPSRVPRKPWRPSTRPSPPRTTSAPTSAPCRTGSRTPSPTCRSRPKTCRPPSPGSPMPTSPSEMTNFVRNQILTQSAVAMLSQANSLPQMAMQLMQG